MTTAATLRAIHAVPLGAFLHHPFFLKVQDGTLTPAARNAYFAYEHHFVNQAVIVLGHVLVKAPSQAARAHLVHMLDGLVTDQAEVFSAIFRKIGPPATQMPPAVVAFCEGMTAIASEGTYAAGLTAMLAAEWTYGEVAKRLMADSVTDPLMHAWFELHTQPRFLDGVAWLEAELQSALGPTFPGSAPLDEVSQAFHKAIGLEVAFHDAPLEPLSRS